MFLGSETSGGQGPSEAERLYALQNNNPALLGAIKNKVRDAFLSQHQMHVPDSIIDQIANNTIAIMASPSNLQNYLAAQINPQTEAVLPFVNQAVQTFRDQQKAGKVGASFVGAFFPSKGEQEIVGSSEAAEYRPWWLNYAASEKNVESTNNSYRADYDGDPGTGVADRRGSSGASDGDYDDLYSNSENGTSYAYNGYTDPYAPGAYERYSQNGWGDEDNGGYPDKRYPGAYADNAAGPQSEGNEPSPFAADKFYKADNTQPALQARLSGQTDTPYAGAVKRAGAMAPEVAAKKVADQNIATEAAKRQEADTLKNMISDGMATPAQTERYAALEKELKAAPNKTEVSKGMLLRAEMRGEGKDPNTPSDVADKAQELGRQIDAKKAEVKALESTGDALDVEAAQAAKADIAKLEQKRAGVTPASINPALAARAQAKKEGVAPPNFTPVSDASKAAARAYMEKLTRPDEKKPEDVKASVKGEPTPSDKEFSMSSKKNSSVYAGLKRDDAKPKTIAELQMTLKGKETPKVAASESAKLGEPKVAETNPPAAPTAEAGKEHKEAKVQKQTKTVAAKLAGGMSAV